MNFLLSLLTPTQIINYYIKFAMTIKKQGKACLNNEQYLHSHAGQIGNWKTSSGLSIYINKINKKESFSLQYKHKNYYTRPEIRSLRQSFVKAKALKQWMSSKQELSAAFYFSC